MASSNNCVWLLGSDNQGSVLSRSDGGGSQELRYTAYGEGQHGEHSALLAYTGAYLDPVTEGYLLGNGYRTYLPDLLRFTAPDSASPFGAGGPNAYAYCDGDPINERDPTGHAGEDEDTSAEVNGLDTLVSAELGLDELEAGEEALGNLRQQQHDSNLIEQANHPEQANRRVNGAAAARPGRSPATPINQASAGFGSAGHLGNVPDIDNAEALVQAKDLHSADPVSIYGELYCEDVGSAERASNFSEADFFPSMEDHANGTMAGDMPAGQSPGININSALDEPAVSSWEEYAFRMSRFVGQPQNTEIDKLRDLMLNRNVDRWEAASDTLTDNTLRAPITPAPINSTPPAPINDDDMFFS